MTKPKRGEPGSVERPHEVRTVLSPGSEPPKSRAHLFQKGQSGNPGGRPAVSGPLKELARAHTDDALATLVAALRAKQARTRVAAAEALLDRGWGRPSQHHEIDAGDDLAKMLDLAWKRSNDQG